MYRVSYVSSYFHCVFGWQVKYGAFSVSVSRLESTIEYIKIKYNTIAR